MVWRQSHPDGRIIPRAVCEYVDGLAGDDGYCRVSFRLHAAENTDLAVDGAGRLSRCDAAFDGMDRGAGRDRCLGLGALCNSVSLAVSALPGDRLDVSRRLWPRRNSPVAG